MKTPNEGPAAADRYTELLTSVAAFAPTVAAELTVAHGNRVRWIEHYIAKEAGTFRGLEDYVAYLERLETAYRRSSALAGLSALVLRVRSDFLAAVEAAFSGMREVCFDLMRDVMEAELLFVDFSGNPGNIAIWLAADADTQRRQFAPARLRERIAERQGIDPEKLLGTQDYRAHSRFLHVTTAENPFGGRGIQDVQDLMRMDMCFWEMLEHARRFAFAGFKLAEAVGLDDRASLDPNTAIPHFRDSWQLSQSVQTIYLMMLRDAGGPVAE